MGIDSCVDVAWRVEFWCLLGPGWRCELDCSLERGEHLYYSVFRFHHSFQ